MIWSAGRRFAYAFAVLLGLGLVAGLLASPTSALAVGSSTPAVTQASTAMTAATVAPSERGVGDVLILRPDRGGRTNAGASESSVPRRIGVAAEEVGTVAPRSLDTLSQQGAQLDRNGLTQAGRSLQKHANRPGSAGQNVLDDILTNPLTAERSYVHPSFGPVREFQLPDMGARFEEFGRLIGFL